MTQVIKLEKDQVISLTKDSGLVKGLFGLAWKPTPGIGRVDLDASCLGINAADKAVEFVFYGNKSGMNAAVSLSGDDLTGADDGEGINAPDEVITIDLEQIPENIVKLLLIIDSYSGQKFGAVQDVFCRVNDYYSNTNLLEYDLDAEYNNDTAIVVAKLDRLKDNPNQWNFTAVGKGFPGGVRSILKTYGMNVS